MSETGDRKSTSAPVVTASMVPSDLPNAVLPFGLPPVDLVAMETEAEEVSPSLRERIRAFADSWGYRSEQDFAGNVLVRVKGARETGRTVMTVSHMDEIGLVVTGINKDGSLRVHKLGGMLPWKIGERPVDILTDKGDTITGITSFGAGHSQVGKNEITWERMRIRCCISSRRKSI